MQEKMTELEQKKLHRKKIVAPVMIAVLLVVYYIGFFACCMVMTMRFLPSILFGVIPLALAGVVIYVLVERIKEIRSGEEDDLSKY